MDASGKMGMLGIIGGTGLAEALCGQAAGADRVVETPFGLPSGPIRAVRWEGLEIALLSRHGEGHRLSPSQVPYRANIYALKALGVTHIVASGAVGSLREQIQPGELVIVDQVIDRTCRRTPTFFDEGLAVHVELAEPFCPRLRQWLLALAEGLSTTVHSAGTYVCIEGPAFSTRAEAELHRSWGADVVGMTAMPEARLAREAEIAYALLALVTDHDCWRLHAPGQSRPRLLEEITANLRAATDNAIALLRALVALAAREPLPRSPAHDALELAIWSDRTRVPSEVVARYGPLLARYFK